MEPHKAGVAPATIVGGVRRPGPTAGNLAAVEKMVEHNLEEVVTTSEVASEEMMKEEYKADIHAQTIAETEARNNQTRYASINNAPAENMNIGQPRKHN